MSKMVFIYKESFIGRYMLHESIKFGQITSICIMIKYKGIVPDYSGIDQATISNRTTSLLFERSHDINSNVTQLSWRTLVKIKTM